MEPPGMGKAKQSAVDISLEENYANTKAAIQLYRYSKAVEIRGRKRKSSVFHSNHSPSSVSLQDFEVPLKPAVLDHLTSAN